MLRKQLKNSEAPYTKKVNDKINFHDILDSLDEGCASCRMIYDAGKPVDFRVLYANPALAKLTGLTLKKVIGRTAKEINPKIEPFWFESFDRVVRSGKSDHFENKVTSIGKQYEVKVWPSAAGCFTIMLDDVTSKYKKAANITLQAAALEAAANGIVITDTKGIILWGNNAFTKLSGYNIEEVVGKSISILSSGKQDKLFFKNLWETLLSGKMWHGEMVNRKKDGTHYIEEQIITPVRGGNGKIERFIAIKQNVSARKKLEVDLTEKNENLEKKGKSQEDIKQAMLNIMEDLDEARRVIELKKVKDEAMLASIGEGLIALDTEGKVMVINKAAENMLGWKEKELLGKGFAIVQMEDEEGRLIANNKRPTYISLSTGKMINCNYYLVRKDATKFPAAITVTPIKINKQIIGAINIFHDVTREKEIDRAKTEFVSLASHQLRTPLGISKWYLEAIRANGFLNKAPKIVIEYINEVYKSNERLLALVRDLLSISRIDQGKIRR